MLPSSTLKLDVVGCINPGMKAVSVFADLGAGILAIAEQRTVWRALGKSGEVNRGCDGDGRRREGGRGSGAAR